MKRSKRILLTAGVALALGGIAGIGDAPTLAQTVDIVRAAQAAQVDRPAMDHPVVKIAQSNPQPAPPAAQSPMVKPPDAAAGPASATNPDNMPIQRPDKPTNDKMSRQPPASAANAK